MRQLPAIARYTFFEAVRNKVLYSIVFFAVVLMGLAVVLGSASIGQDERIVKDVGLFAISFFSDMIAIFLGVTMVYAELERKTVYNLLSKPIQRPTYFIGKYLGMCLTLSVQVLFMGAVLTALIYFRGDSLPVSYFYALFLTWLQCLFVASVALFFSSFSTPYVSGFMTLGLWMIGNLIQELAGYLPSMKESLVKPVLSVVTHVVPDLNLLTLTTQVTYGIEVPLAYVFQVSLYILAYLVAFLLAGTFIFQRRDFI